MEGVLRIKPDAISIQRDISLRTITLVQRDNGNYKLN